MSIQLPIRYFNGEDEILSTRIPGGYFELHSDVKLIQKALDLHTAGVWSKLGKVDQPTWDRFRIIIGDRVLEHKL